MFLAAKRGLRTGGAADLRRAVLRTLYVLRTLAQGLVRLVHACRRYEFRDCRLILEQDGEVHYLAVPAQLQLRAVRFACASFAATGALVLGMVIVSATLSYGKERLERSHREIFRALLETNDPSQAESGALSEEDMIAIADSIRRRNLEIRRFVDRSTASISDENEQLAEALHASGLTEKAIRVIQMNTPIGGSTETIGTAARDAQVGALAKAIASNRSLRDVLAELPEHLPLDSPGVSSGFGLRVNPISHKTQFHAGVDLLPSADLLVHPARRGTVALASYGQEIGNVVIVRHGGGVETRYGHMASISVREGDEVTERSVLGIVGNTGTATTGRHLHFEVTVGGYPVDPLKVIETAQNVRKIENQR
jgi:murein DD-endopeptidase MepM/ murein hydrolase activator NlpD